MTREELVDRLLREIIAAKVASKTRILGCTDDQIREIEVRQGGPLPEAYEAFMRAMGRGAGVLFRGTDIFYPDVLDLRDEADALLVENGNPIRLGSDALVFAMHQGYRFLYFQERSADPPVWLYLEGQGASQHSVSFGAFLEGKVREHAKLVERGVLPPGF